MTRIYYQYAIAAVICFDISRPSTLDNVKKWRDDINEKVVLSNGKPIPMILLANKCDIPDIKMDHQKLDQFANENGFFAWFETSSKTNHNIDTAFNTLIEHILNLTKDLKVVNPDSKKEGVVNILEKNEQENKVPQSITISSGCCG